MKNDIVGALLQAVASGPEGTRPPHLLVGYSGGLDSTVLLHALAKAHPARVRAIHVHHGLHADADDWAGHCQHTCDALGLPLTIARVDVVDVDAGPEAAARAARHRAFEAHLQVGEWLALAHHRDDQAETFLLRALRGSGPDGLAAVRPWRRFGDGWLWRPLLELPQAALRAYAEANALDWVDDPSNASSQFDRNFLRNEVMPVLRQRWPQADAAFARAARWQQQANTALQATDADDFDAASSPLPLMRLRALSPLQRARSFRAWTSQLGWPPPPARAIEWLEAELAKPPTDGASKCRWDGALLRRWRDALYPDDDASPLPADLDIEWDGRDELILPNGLRWTLAGAVGFEAPLHVGPRLGGERIQLPGRQHRHLLKHVLQDRGLPPWRRAAIPLLFDVDGELLAAGDIYSARWDAWLRDRGASLVLSEPAHD